MTARDFRRLALGLPETIQRAHVGHPDFRVGKRIFATLGYPDAGWAMVRLLALQQTQFVAAYPRIFSRVPGGWGARGATAVRRKAATTRALRPALFEAWRNVAAQRLRGRADAT